MGKGESEEGMEELRLESSSMRSVGREEVSDRSFDLPNLLADGGNRTRLVDP